MTRHCGFAAIIGPPNAGKSTLVNALTGQKVAIVTHKAQTTRMRLRGIMMYKSAQIILVDTPGIFEPRRRFDRAMVDAAWGAVQDADILVIVLDASRPMPPETDIVLEGLQARQRKQKTYLVLNQVDRVAKPALLELAARLDSQAHFHAIFMVSALKGEGLSELRDALAGAAPRGSWAYPSEQAADIPIQLLAAEITREKLFLRLHQELPYALTVETEQWERRKDGSLHIRQIIYIRRENQRAIILGHGGAMIKQIGKMARLEMEAAFEARVHLFLFVKVRENWQNDPERYAALGLSYTE